MDILDAIPVLRDLPPTVTVALVAMLPVIELRGAIPVGAALGLGPWETFVAAVIGNIIPIIPLVYLLDPVQKWLSRHFKFFDRFFTWLFARTRAKHSARYEKMKDVALVLFVAVPLPGTGGWTGVAAAYVFGVKKGRAVLLVSLGIVIAGIVVTVFTEAGKAVVNR